MLSKLLVYNQSTNIVLYKNICSFMKNVFGSFEVRNISIA